MHTSIKNSSFVLKWIFSALLWWVLRDAMSISFQFIGKEDYFIGDRGINIQSVNNYDSGLLFAVGALRMNTPLENEPNPSTRSQSKRIYTNGVTLQNYGDSIQDASQATIQGAILDSTQDSIQRTIQDSIQDIIQETTKDFIQGTIQGSIQDPIQEQEDIKIGTRRNKNFPRHIGTPLDTIITMADLKEQQERDELTFMQTSQGESVHRRPIKGQEVRSIQNPGPRIRQEPFEQKKVSEFLNKQGHTNNWAVLVCTSRFWFNYRHIANTLSFYHIVKQMGIPDDQIILMLADDVACNARNPYPAQIFNNANKKINLYGDDVQVDYRGYEVTVENFIRVLTGRHDKHVPLTKRLRTNEQSNILIYLTGHGGNEFLKFQDSEEISAMDIADAIHQMYEKRRYHEILIMVDTCQAGTLFNHIYSPGVIAAGSSRIEENSYSHHSNLDVGVAIIDRFTYYTLEFFERQNLYRGGTSNVTMQKKYNDHLRRTITLGQLFRYYNPHKVLSHPVFKVDQSIRDVESIPLTDFFAQEIRIDFTRTKAVLRDLKSALVSDDWDAMFADSVDEILDPIDIILAELQKTNEESFLKEIISKFLVWEESLNAEKCLWITLFCLAFLLVTFTSGL